MLQAFKLNIIPATLLTAIASTTSLAAPPTNQLPTNGRVIAGQAEISQSGSTMLVNESTNRAVVNWDSFNVGINASVKFQQPSTSAVILNRVTGNDSSQIYGQLTSNGQVYLVNTNGIYFSPTSSVNVGSFLASTLDIETNRFIMAICRSREAIQKVQL